VEQTIESTVAAHEKEISLIRDDLDSLKTDMARGFDRLLQRIDGLSTANLQGRTVNWGWVISGVMMTVGIGSLVVAGLISDITRNESAVAKQLDTFVAHIGDGHPRRVEDKVIEVRDRLERMESQNDAEHKQIDEMLQREMRLLDTTLQREMALNNQILAERIEALDSKISIKSANRFTGAEGRLMDKRITALERVITQMHAGVTQ